MSPLEKSHYDDVVLTTFARVSSERSLCLRMVWTNERVYRGARGAQAAERDRVASTSVADHFGFISASGDFGQIDH